MIIGKCSASGADCNLASVELCLNNASIMLSSFPAIAGDESISVLQSDYGERFTLERLACVVPASRLNIIADST